MSNSNVIMKVENLSKLYRLGLIGTGTLSHDLNRFWHQLLGKEDPYSTIGQVNDRTTTSDSDYVWALQDINFDVFKGEVLGVIGKNGAGKSTLLKILSKVTGPTTGNVKAKGRIASLLEVGTGFHPELTGKENVFLNGAILGMTRREITSKLDEIISFSGCERYIDTPVKRYSSGMKVRLAFAVAAHLEPEILVVDEVLAVGDAEFQKKAIGKMKEISSGEGRTVIFVSHNMTAVQSLCHRAILMQHGKITQTGQVDHIVDQYLRLNSETLLPSFYHKNLQDAPGNEQVRIRSMKVNPDKITIESDFYIDIELVNTGNQSRFYIAIDFVNMNEVVAFGTGSSVDVVAGNSITTRCLIPGNLMNDDEYLINLYLLNSEKVLLYSKQSILSFEIRDSKREEFGYLQKVNGVVRPKLNWVIQ